MNYQECSQLASQWNDVIKELMVVLGEQAIGNWLHPLTILEQKNGEIIIASPTKFIKNWVETNYDAQIKQAWKKINPAIKNISYVVTNNDFSIFESGQNLNSSSGNTIEEKELSYSVFSRRLEL